MRQLVDGAKQSTRRGGPAWPKTCKKNRSVLQW